MKFCKRTFAAVLAALLALLTIPAARAEVSYEWQGEFPPTPELEHHAYRRAGIAVDLEACVARLWDGLDWTKDEGEDFTTYELAGGQNPRGKYGELVRLWKNHGVITYEQVWQDESRAGYGSVGYQDARMEAEAFLESWLPQEMLAHPAPFFGSYDEDGNSVDHHYQLIWNQQIESVACEVDEAGLRVEYYDGAPWFIVLRWYAFEPVERDAPAYLGAEDALRSLNYAAAHIDPAHTCTSFDDPEDELVLIEPAFSGMFNEDETMTLCWAFFIRDAEKKYVRVVLVDAISGDIFDEHDGRLTGCFQ